MSDDIDSILGVTPSPQREARNQAPPIPMGEAPRHISRPHRRRFINALRAKTAADTLGGIPAAGETWHCLMNGTYDGFDLLPAILDHAGTAVAELRLATLGFNIANATRLLDLMDENLVRRCTMLLSSYFEADPKDADTCYLLARELPRRGGWYCATRCHAKVIAARLLDGRCYVVESSANLRSCNAIEQFALTCDPDLYAFHAAWMEEVHDTETRRIAAGRTPGR